MLQSICLCTNKVRVDFKEIIKYSDEKVFKNYEGTSIGKCTRCGMLKTFPSKKNKKFNTQQSRNNFYESNGTPFLKLFNPLLSALNKYQPSGSVLEAGCSSGILLSLLKKKGFDVTGIEPNKEAFKSAQKKLGKFIFNGTLPKFVRYYNKKFDCIIYNHVLEHVEDVNKELSLVKKMIKPNGILIVGVPNTDNIIFTIRRKYWESLMPNEHVWHFSTQRMTSLLEKHGFKVISKSFSNHTRTDYPLLKRIYFGILCLINQLINTGEAVLVVAKKG